jgi:thioredoxin 1
MLAPFLERLAGEFTGRIKFAKLNVDEAPGLAARYGITGVPTLVLFLDGNVVGRIVGLSSPRHLRAMLEHAARSVVTA